MKSDNLVLFEPWNLGDAIIAFAIALQDPAHISLACNSKWHKLLRATAQGTQVPKLFAVDLGYVSRGKRGYFEFGNLPSINADATVLSIRGDLRDALAARKIFAGSKVQVNGWMTFAAKTLGVVDTPFSRGWLPVRNRYHSWACIAGIDWQGVEKNYMRKQTLPQIRSILIHIGAQWRSRQYPHVDELVDRLKRAGNVQIIAGPGDILPAGVTESQVLRPIDSELVSLINNSSHVVTNDSGPMHLAALLRRRTMVIARQAAISQWRPPAITAIVSKRAPRGYRSLPLSDAVSPDWPAPEEIMKHLDAFDEAGGSTIYV
jgi:hypothetical protein